MSSAVKAAPVQFNQVVQVINAKPGKANVGNFAQLRLRAGDDPVLTSGGDDPKPSDPAAPQQDDPRVITETRSEIVEEEVCDCVTPPVGAGFPYYALGLAGVPLLFLIPPGGDSPGDTPTATPTPTDTPTPNSPTPNEPVPEPMTILLFGTGLAGVGLAARRRFGKKEDEESEGKE